MLNQTAQHWYSTRRLSGLSLDSRPDPGAKSKRHRLGQMKTTGSTGSTGTSQCFQLPCVPVPLYPARRAGRQPRASWPTASLSRDGRW